MTSGRRLLARKGDFDFLVGEFTAANRRLRHKHVGSDEWDEFPARLNASILLDGAVSVNDIHFPTLGWTGFAMRTLNVERQAWAIYWINSTDGILQPPVYGGFDGDAGEFYGSDFDGDLPVLVRFLWKRPPTYKPYWEQAFSLDGQEWETNWTMEFERVG